MIGGGFYNLTRQLLRDKLLPQMVKWNFFFWSQMINVRICNVQYRGGFSHGKIALEFWGSLPALQWSHQW